MEEQPRALVILSSVRWNFAWQRHHALARAASAAGVHVVFVEPHPRDPRQLLGRLRRRSSAPAPTQLVPPGVEVLRWSPGDLLAGRARRRIERALGASRLDARGTGAKPGDQPEGSAGGENEGEARDDLMVLQYVPSRRFLALASALRPGMLVYDRVLDWAKVPQGWYPPRGWRQVEAELERRAALATDSPVMQAEWADRGLRSLVLLPAADDEFAQHDWPDPPPDGPIGYFGTVQRDIIDLGAIAAIARDRGVEVVGDVDEASRSLLEASGVRVRPAVPIGALPSIIDRWSAILLPYRVGDRADTLVPAKIWNSLASRRPVITQGLELPAEISAHTVRLEDRAAIAAGLEPREAPEPIDPASIPTWGGAWNRLLALARSAPCAPGRERRP